MLKRGGPIWELSTVLNHPVSALNRTSNPPDLVESRAAATAVGGGGAQADAGSGKWVPSDEEESLPEHLDPPNSSCINGSWWFSQKCWKKHLFVLRSTDHGLFNDVILMTLF